MNYCKNSWQIKAGSYAQRRRVRRYGFSICPLYLAKAIPAEQRQSFYVPCQYPLHALGVPPDLAGVDDPGQRIYALDLKCHAVCE